MSDPPADFAAQARASAHQLELASAWCRERFIHAPAGVHVRAADESDAPVLLAMEAQAFAMFDRPDSANRLFPYRCPNATMQSFGYLLKTVACTERGIGAYMLVQVRNWGELHICEVVARPLDAQQRIRSAGALLLGVAARLAQQIGVDLISAQVRRLDGQQPIAGYRSERIIAHDQRHGLLLVARQGILPDGRLSAAEDAWLEGIPADILAKLLRKFGGADQMAPPAPGGAA